MIIYAFLHLFKKLSKLKKINEISKTALDVFHNNIRNMISSKFYENFTRYVSLVPLKTSDLSLQIIELYDIKNKISYAIFSYTTK